MILFDDEVWVHYGQCYVFGPDDPHPQLAESFAGQRAGLCGGATPGVLYLITGLHTGKVGFRVELHETKPPLDNQWEEIVEVAYRPRSDEVNLVEWGGNNAWSLPLAEVDYRVRYCATGMARARQLDTRVDGAPQADRYLLQFWPSRPLPARVIKHTSAAAVHWHDWAAALPPPAPRLPSRGKGLARLDQELADLVAAAAPEKQRAIARWAARRAYAVAGIADLDWVAPALVALDRDEALPPPFDTADRLAWTRLYRSPGVPRNLITKPDGRSGNFRQQAAAFPALLAATQDDPRQAAVEALHAAAIAHGRDGYRALLEDAHWEFFG